MQGKVHSALYKSHWFNVAHDSHIENLLASMARYCQSSSVFWLYRPLMETLLCINNCNKTLSSKPVQDLFLGRNRIQIRLRDRVNYLQDIQICTVDIFCYLYHIVADIWVSDYVHIRGYADLDISRMLPQYEQSPKVLVSKHCPRW
jgi:hypothetical protein